MVSMPDWSAVPHRTDMPLPLLRAVPALALTSISTSHADDVAAPGRYRKSDVLSVTIQRDFRIVASCFQTGSDVRSNLAKPIQLTEIKAKIIIALDPNPANPRINL